MLTPAYAPTATERVLPRLALDFTTGVLDSRVTVTRALNTATRVNSSGLVEIVNANLPRFDYDPITLAPKGLLIEEARTNSCSYSQDLNTGWYLLNASASNNATQSPDGAVNADKLVENTANGVHLAENFIGTTSGSVTWSVYAKAAGRNWLMVDAYVGASNVCFFDLANGAVGTNTSGGTATITPVGNNWFRCTVTRTGGAGTYVTYRLANADNSTVYTGDGTSGIYIWGAQVEAGAFATSYIPTTTSSLTRNADAVSMTGTNFSSWANASEGALLTKGSVYADSSDFRRFASFNDGVSGDAIFSCCSSGFSGRGFVVASGSTQASFNYGSFSVNTSAAILLAYKANNIAGAMNGGAVSTDGTANLPAVTQLNIGSQAGTASSWLNGHIQEVLYWPQRVINNEVQAFSK